MRQQFFFLLFSAASAFGNAHPESEWLATPEDFVLYEPQKRTTYQLDTTGWSNKYWQPHGGPPVDYLKKRLEHFRTAVKKAPITSFS